VILLKNFNLAVQEIEFSHQVKLETDEYFGDINKVKLEDGLIVYNWNIVLKEDHVFTYQHQAGLENHHLLILNFEQQPNRIIHHAEKKQQYDPRSPWFIYLTDSEKAEFVYKQGQSIRFVVIMFLQEWFNEQVRIADGDDDYGKDMLTKLSDHVFGHLSMAQTELAAQLYHHFVKPPSVLTFKSDLYKLINMFIAYENINHHELLNATTDLMHRFREKLLANLKTPLPGMEELAKEFHTSVSSLKRHFKATFGQNIYDYYLSRKMELAHKLITDQGLNVSQAAFELGYESVSHFSATFTKHFGIHPGELRKNDQSHT